MLRERERETGGKRRKKKRPEAPLRGQTLRNLMEEKRPKRKINYVLFHMKLLNSEGIKEKISFNWSRVSAQIW